MARKILLVEGVDDYNVVLNIQGHHNIRPLDKKEIRNTEGYTRLLTELPIHLKAGLPDSIVGAILDADENLAHRWQSVSDKLKELGYSVPRIPDKHGTIIGSPRVPLPRVGIWLMPNNQTNGVLEDFLHFLIPAGDRLIPYAKEVIDTEALPEQRFSDLARIKALMHTWLAWQQEPGKPFGLAIKARYLDAGLPEAQSFVTWLQKLYS
ncbi:MAG: DUF3226 domain-containing protein [Candidatus Methylacidiphilales bacterium]|nr:DUF3226 domain-containing protein [Candidatus Methylacidiphilales bacterium]